MKNRIMALTCLFVGTPLMLIAAENKHDHHGAQSQHKHESMASGAAAHSGHMHAMQGKEEKSQEINTLKQKTCPVSGKPIDKKIFITHEGQKVYFCCKDCVGKFKKSPNKYLPALYKQIYTQSVQVKCPVMGGTVNPEVFTEYKGQRIYYCCPGCDSKFKADPAKYLEKLPEISTEQVHCPITGKPINPKHHMEIGGKTVYCCSEDCGPKFKADLKHYMSTLRPEAGLLARGATAQDDLLICPVCLPKGGIHKRSEVKFTEYKGFQYAMCGSSCTESFKKDPQKYVNALRQKMIELAGGDEKAYTCSMHPSVIQTTPGKCPVCSMKLTPVK